MDTLISAWLLSPIAVSAVATLLFKKQQLVSGLRHVFSRFLHVSHGVLRQSERICYLRVSNQNLLLRFYPIRDAETGSTNLPATPFWGSDGNGDEAKFLDGPHNSLRWGKSYGPIYRTWSGTNTEV